MVKKAAETTFFFSLIELILQPWHSIHALIYRLSKAQQRRLHPPQKYRPRGIADIGPHGLGALALTSCDSLGIGGARKAGRIFWKRQPSWNASINRPSKEIEGWYDKGEGEEVSDLRGQQFFGPWRAHFLGQKAGMDRDYHRDCYVIKGFGKHSVGHARLLPRQPSVAASATIFFHIFSPHRIIWK